MFTQDNFQEWIFYIDTKMDSFTNEFAREKNLTLNCSIESLDELENWILSTFIDSSELIDEPKLLDS